MPCKLRPHLCHCHPKVANLLHATMHALSITAAATAMVNWQEHVKREKRLMALCDCPFMVNLVTSFQDDDNLYLLLECIMGGEFFTFLQVPNAVDLWQQSGPGTAITVACLSS